MAQPSQSSKSKTSGAGGGAAPAPTFEESLARIEEIVERLEGGDLPLDESLKLFQEGVELSRRCQSSLDAAQRRIEQLVRSADGTPGLQPLDDAAGDDADAPA